MYFRPRRVEGNPHDAIRECVDHQGEGDLAAPGRYRQRVALTHTDLVSGHGGQARDGCPCGPGEVRFSVLHASGIEQHAPGRQNSLTQNRFRSLARRRRRMLEDGTAPLPQRDEFGSGRGDIGETEPEAHGLRERVENAKIRQRPGVR